MESDGPESLLHEELLRQALHDPFGSAVLEWYEHLIEHVPLWAFHAPSYGTLSRSDLPTTYPLLRMVVSILEDEGVKIHHKLTGLPAILDRLRLAIADTSVHNASRVLAEPRPEPRRPEFFPELVADLARWEPEGGFVFRIYEYLVMEDVLEIVRIKDGIAETLSGLQSNGLGFHVRMRR